MKKIFAFGIGALAAATIVTSVSTTSFAYEVKSGDTLSKIAAENNLTVEELMALNGITNANQIYAGETIKVTKESGKYVVRCLVTYTDYTDLSVIRAAYTDNTFKPITAYGEGIVYEQEFDKLTPIYLLYAPAICNGVYCPIDEITVDTQAIPGEDVKVYVFETAAEISKTYKDVICEQFGVDNINKITYSNPMSATTKSKVKVRTFAAGTSNPDSIELFTNFKTDAANSTLPAKTTAEDSSGETYLYDVTITIKDSQNNVTKVTGIRGR